MSIRPRALLAAALAVAAFGATASSASAAITTPGGTFSGATTSNQTLSARVGILTLTISCSQTVNFNIRAGSYSGAAQTIGSLTGVSFTCGSGSSATALNLPWPIVANESDFTASSGRVTVNNVQVQVATPAGTCLFSGSIPLTIGNGTAAGALGGATLTRVSGPCTSNGTVSSAPYSFAPSPGPTWTL